ncbi:hypothetical protein [Nocardia bovistercoris]|uniref:Uncharacterized protein n=1 Tax=Nocardia bovistercoris TaxID=2785916 RepID=A0A931IDL3_9NOCA|nr:hypothetical protein [Nocardia bovistercoris]MBH0779474.1 hypothetical protein [Nocardia bovistercoris]
MSDTNIPDRLEQLEERITALEGYRAQQDSDQQPHDEFTAFLGGIAHTLCTPRTFTEHIGELLITVGTLLSRPTPDTDPAPDRPEHEPETDTLDPPPEDIPVSPRVELWRNHTRGTPELAAPTRTDDEIGTLLPTLAFRLGEADRARLEAEAGHHGLSIELDGSDSDEVDRLLGEHAARFGGAVETMLALVRTGGGLWHFPPGQKATRLAPELYRRQLLATAGSLGTSQNVVEAAVNLDRQLRAVVPVAGTGTSARLVAPPRDSRWWTRILDPSAEAVAAVCAADPRECRVFYPEIGMSLRELEQKTTIETKPTRFPADRPNTVLWPLRPSVSDPKSPESFSILGDCIVGSTP